MKTHETIWTHIKRGLRGLKSTSLVSFNFQPKQGSRRSGFQKTLALHCGSQRRRHRKIHPSWSRSRRNNIVTLTCNKLQQIVTTYDNIMAWLSFHHQGQDNEIGNVMAQLWCWLRSDDMPGMTHYDAPPGFIPEGPVCSQCPRKVNPWPLSLSTSWRCNKKPKSLTKTHVTAQQQEDIIFQSFEALSQSHVHIPWQMLKILVR